VSELKDVMPQTPIQAKCALAESKLGDAATEYCFALYDDQVERGRESEAAWIDAYRETVIVTAGQVVALMVGSLLVMDQKVPPKTIETVFQLMMSQVTRRVTEEIPSIVSALQEVERKARS
jgi:hypothetical protein